MADQEEGTTPSPLLTPGPSYFGVWIRHCLVWGIRNIRNVYLWNPESRDLGVQYPINPLTPKFPPKKRFFRVQMPFHGHCLAKSRPNSQNIVRSSEN